MQNILASMPEWITHGLSVAGGILPAMGFAMTIYIIGKNNIYHFSLLHFSWFNI